jgi:hypothetical protein
MAEETEKIEKSDYFTNPKKDTGKRRGRPPGSKNKKTIEAEQKSKSEDTKKSKVVKDYDIADWGGLGFMRSELPTRCENIRDLTDIFSKDRISDSEYLQALGILTTLRDWAEKSVNWMRTCESIGKSEKPVVLKGYRGHWTPIAKSGYYTMWESVEMGDKAYNVITKTMKNRKTGKLVEKMAFEDVDGFNDAKVQSIFKSKSEVAGEEVASRKRAMEQKEGYKRISGPVIPKRIFDELVDMHKQKYLSQGLSEEEAVAKATVEPTAQGTYRILNSAESIADLEIKIRQDLIEEGFYSDSQIDEIVDYITDHTSVDSDGNYIFEAEEY